MIIFILSVFVVSDFSKKCTKSINPEIQNSNPNAIDNFVLLTKEIRNTNSNQINIEFLVGSKTITNFDINENKHLNIVKVIDSTKDHLKFKGHLIDSTLLHSLQLEFFPNNIEIKSYEQDIVTTITDFYDIDAKMVFNFYQGIALDHSKEIINTDNSKFAYFETSENAALIQHSSIGNYFVSKMKIYDDQFSYEEDCIYHMKNNWKININMQNNQINVTILLINSDTHETEQSIKYTENCVIQVESRKLLLQFEFDNDDIKVIDTGIDFTQRRKTSITEQLYHNSIIDIILEPYSNIVFFDLNELNCDNETGLIPSHVLFGNDIFSLENNNEIRTEYDESTKDIKYLVYHFKTDFIESDINETLFIVLVSQGFKPLSATEEFSSELYLVEFNEFTFEDGFLIFNIPLVRKCEYNKGDAIRIVSIFAQPLQQEAFCPVSYHYTRFNSKIPIGCIDKNYDLDPILSITAYNREGVQISPTKIKPLEGNYISINIINILVESDCLIARVPTIFPEYSLTMNIDQHLANALLEYKVNNLKIMCERCSRIVRKKKIFAKDDQYFNIELNSEINDDYYAECIDEKGKYCIQKLQLDPKKVTLIKNPMVASIKVLNYLEDYPSISIPKAQLFASYGNEMIIYSKDNIAFLEISNTLDPGINLILKAEVKGKHVRLYSETTNNINFPFNPLSILASSKDSLNSLGLNSENIQQYHIRDEIFIHDINDIEGNPLNPSSELLFGLPSTLITSITYEYNKDSFVPQEVNYLCYCFVESISQECQPDDDCTNFVKLTPHEFSNFDVYLPEKASGKNIIFKLNCDVTNYHPSIRNIPNDVWKFAIYSNDDNIKKFTGSLYIFPSQKVDCYNSIDCNDLDVTIGIDVKNREIGVFDASSSNSFVSFNFDIQNELQNKVESYCSYSTNRDILLNVFHIKDYKFNTDHKQVSTDGQYVYSLIDTELSGHYYLSIIYQENNIHLNESFCVEENLMNDCDKDQIPINPLSLKALWKFIQSHPNVINHIKLHFAKRTTNQIVSDSLIGISEKHYNIDISMDSKDVFDMPDYFNIYYNLNVSFGDHLNLQNTILKQDVKIGTKQKISLNNKSAKKVEITIIPPEKEIEFESTQVLIQDFDSNIEHIIDGDSILQLEHSTLTLSLSVENSKLILNIQQEFNSYGNNICLYLNSVNKCEQDYGLPININGFTENHIATQEEVTITLVTDTELNLKLQSKKVIFKGNVKLSGCLELSSDSTIQINNLDINELKLLLTLDIEKEEISSINLLYDLMLPSSIHCKLINPNSNEFQIKFADLNVFDNLDLKWISDESNYDNFIIATELIINGQTANVKINHIFAKKVLCYYNTDSNVCPPETTRSTSKMWEDFNDSIIYIAEDIKADNVNLNDHLVYFTGNGKIIGNIYFYGSSVVHFIQKQLVEELNLYTFADFNTRKASKIIFGDFNSKPKSWDLKIGGYDITCSFIMIENGCIVPDVLQNGQNLVVENIGPNTIIHFTENYNPNSFCIFNYPYKSCCYSDYPNYMPINSNDLWNIKLKPNYEPKFIFASSLPTLLPLQRFKKENINKATIEVLNFATFPKFLVPEDFTLIIEGESSSLTAKVSINTESNRFGKLFFNNIKKIIMIPVDREVLYDDDKIIIIGSNKYVVISQRISYNEDHQMNEFSAIKTTNDYEYNSRTINNLYFHESDSIIGLKLTSETNLDISKLITKKLAISGSNQNLNIINSSIYTLKLLLIDSANINFDSFLELEVGVFNSDINIIPFATKECLSSDLLYKHYDQIYPIDGSSLSINENSIIVNNKNIPFVKRNANLYMNDFCSIHDSSSKTINIYGKISSIEIDKSEQSLITFNDFDYLIVDSKDDLSNFHFHNNLFVDFNSPNKAQIDFYNLESGSGYFISPNDHSSIKQMNLFGKPFYSENTDVSSLSVFNNKALLKGVVLSNSLQIDPGASLIAHSTTFQSSVSSNFRLTSATPLVVLVDSTFDCSDLLIDVEYAYHKQYTLIKGFQTSETCENIKTKVKSTKKKKKFELICNKNPDDDFVDLIVKDIKNDSKSNKISNGEIAAIVVPILCGVVVFIIILSIYLKKRNENNSGNENHGENENSSGNEDNNKNENEDNSENEDDESRQNTETI